MTNLSYILTLATSSLVNYDLPNSTGGIVRVPKTYDGTELCSNYIQYEGLGPIG